MGLIKGMPQRATRKGVSRKYYRTKSRKQRASGQTGGGQTGGALENEVAAWITTLLSNDSGSAYYESAYDPQQPFPTAEIDANDKDLVDAAVTISKEWFPGVNNGAEFRGVLTPMSINDVALKFMINTENALRNVAGKSPITSLNDIVDYPLFIWALMASAPPDREPLLILSRQPSAQG